MRGVFPAFVRVHIHYTATAPGRRLLEQVKSKIRELMGEVIGD